MNNLVEKVVRLLDFDWVKETPRERDQKLKTAIIAIAKDIASQAGATDEELPPKNGRRACQTTAQPKINLAIHGTLEWQDPPKCFAENVRRRQAENRLQSIIAATMPAIVKLVEAKVEEYQRHLQAEECKAYQDAIKHGKGMLKDGVHVPYGSDVLWKPVAKTVEELLRASLNPSFDIDPEKVDKHGLKHQ